MAKVGFGFIDAKCLTYFTARAHWLQIPLLVRVLVATLGNPFHGVKRPGSCRRRKVASVQDARLRAELANQVKGIALYLYSNDRPGLSQGDVCPTTRAVPRANPSC